MPHVDLNSPDGAKKIASILERRITDLMRMAAIEFYRQVTISTPVDTGRARAGWFVTIGKPSDQVMPEAPQQSGKKRRSKKRSVASKKRRAFFKVPRVDERMPKGHISTRSVVYITNNTPYIMKLNNGYSEQAPARFVETAAAKVQKAMSRLWRKTRQTQNKQS